MKSFLKYFIITIFIYNLILSKTILHHNNVLLQFINVKFLFRLIDSFYTRTTFDTFLNGFNLNMTFKNIHLNKHYIEDISYC